MQTCEPHLVYSMMRTRTCMAAIPYLSSNRRFESMHMRCYCIQCNLLVKVHGRNDLFQLSDRILHNFFRTLAVCLHGGIPNPGVIREDAWRMTRHAIQKQDVMVESMSEMFALCSVPRYDSGAMQTEELTNSRARHVLRVDSQLIIRSNVIIKEVYSLLKNSLRDK